MDEVLERLTELEIRYSHQGVVIEELNQVVIDCCRRIERLEQENAGLREMLRGLAPDLDESPDE